MSTDKASLLSLSLATIASCLVGCVVEPDEGANGDGDAGDGDLGQGQGTGGMLMGTGGLTTGGQTSTGGGNGSGGLGATGGAGTGGLGATGGAGTGGGSATGGADGSGGAMSTGSDGCGMVAGLSTGSWQATSVDTGGGSRPYDVKLPGNYDPMRTYPVVLLLHGCTSGTNNVPVDGQTGEDAIVIRGTGSASNTCWNADVGGSDMDFVDAMVADVQDRFCVNPDHLFAVGYSSGSWLASRLSCNRGDVFRGIATVTGGEPGSISGCSGQVGRMFIHDQGDNDNQIAWNEPSRDRMVSTNNCDSATMPVDPSPCVEYQGCDPGYPVVWCATTGQGHGRQDGFAAPAFWNFFQDLMGQ